MGGRTVLNRNFDDFQITAVRLHFGLEKWTTRSDPAAENNLQRFAGEQLKSAGHVGQLGTEQQIGHESSAETDPVARERSVDKGPARTKPAAEDAVVTLAHVFEERRNVGRLVTESGVDFQNPIRICLERLAISANIRVDDIAIFRRPNDRQLRHLRRMGLEDFPSVVPARLVDDREEFPAAHGRAIHQDGVYETDRRLGLSRHGTSDCERNVFEVAHGRNLDGGGYPTKRKKRADSSPSARSKTNCVDYQASTGNSSSTGRSFLLRARRSFDSAMFCNCRIRSRVTPNFLPTSSSVFGFPPSSPKREKMILRSRSSSTSSNPPTSFRKFLSRSNSNGVWASSSPTISPNSVESSSLIGASSEAGRIETVFSCETLPLAMPISSPSSSSVGSRPSSSLIWSETRRILEILSTRWTGKRIVLLWFASARLIDCLIHQAA